MDGQRIHARSTLMHDRSSSGSTLAAILQDLRPARATYGRLALRAPWGIDLPIEDGVRFHLVVSGRCLLQAPGGEALLEPGDVALLPGGEAHAIRDRPTSEAVPLAILPRQAIGDGVYRLQVGTDGEESLLVCCTVDFDAAPARRLLTAMPALLVVRRGTDGPGLDGLVALMADEARRERMGMATLLPRLVDVVVTWTVRAWAEEAGASVGGWLGALAEPGLGRALVAIHAAPERRWTTTALAREAGLSRSAFARRFQERLGQAPGRYLLEWRMALAAERLASRAASIASVAAGLGYGSEAAFARAFKRVRGVSPGRLRRRAGGG